MLRGSETFCPLPASLCGLGKQPRNKIVLLELEIMAVRERNIKNLQLLNFYILFYYILVTILFLLSFLVFFFILTKLRLCVLGTCFLWGNAVTAYSLIIISRNIQVAASYSQKWYVLAKKTAV
eukprot:TRINITY_DN25024_c1_g1_i5.p4 TRINITY_DN25024_c1_g1~~TRINITY_DN25024_c1_g1_i5.p4  ORF type:complete len:123 (-),score=3.86 TRINITY_DN25024_c1_g1_i5:707-1075(-)